MTAKMPEPIGYFACNPETLEPVWSEDCVCQDNIYNQEDMGAIGRAIIFSDQAEAYAAARVREAIEEIAQLVDDRRNNGLPVDLRGMVKAIRAMDSYPGPATEPKDKS